MDNIMDNFMGHPIPFWMELETNARVANTVELIQEIAELRGKEMPCEAWEKLSLRDKLEIVWHILNGISPTQEK